MTALLIIAAVAGFGMVLGIVIGLCEAAAEGRAEVEEARIIAEARGMGIDLVGELERTYALPAHDPERIR